MDTSPENETLLVLARALVRAVVEHGLPNAFSAGELASYYGAPTPLITGRLATQRIEALDAIVSGGPFGAEPFTVTYEVWRRGRGRSVKRFLCRAVP